MIATSLKDGKGITVAFAGHTTLYLDPNSLTPPGISGGDAIDTTTHSNSAWKTKTPQQLLEALDGSFTAAYDPDNWSAIVACLNQNVAITITFPNSGAGTLVFYGFLQTFVPNAYVPGEMPTAECVIVVTNENGSGVETAPVYTP
jgi:hypothetical protein